MKFLRLLIIPILFFACKTEKCPPPLCLPPPYGLDLNIVFDTSNTSFTQEELSEVIFSNKNIAHGFSIRTDTVRYLGENNSDYTIQILWDENGISQYYYEIKIPALNSSYIIDEVKVQVNNNDPCNCPDYYFKSFELNDSLVILESQTLVLKK